MLEPLSGYLVLAQKLYNDLDQYAVGWNFGPNEQDVKSVDWILDKMISKWPNSSWVLDSNHNPYEADFLKLDFFPRSGGGIGMTRLIRSMKMENLL